MACIESLPNEMWEKICRPLDGASLLALAQAAPSRKDTVLQPRLVRSLTFTCDTDERILDEFSRRQLFRHVQSLRFKSCLALSSRAIFSFVASCSDLRHLNIVGCVVEPAHLFRLLAVILRKVRKLEWTLHEECYYESRFENATQKTADQPMSRPLNLEEMYVEVAANCQNVALLEAILRRCHELDHLHVHAVRKEVDSPANVEACALLMRPRPGLTTFTHSCELVPVPKARLHAWRWLPFPVVQTMDLVCDNVSYILKPEVSLNFVSLTEQLQKDVPLRSTRSIIVGVEADAKEPCRFVQAAAKPEHWKDVRSVSLAQLSARLHRFPVQPMKLFFATCLSCVTELNLTSFHFSCDSAGFSDVALALSQLRALALAPCAVNKTDSLKCLLRGCKNLEELDVRREHDFPCESCGIPLELAEDSFEQPDDRSTLRVLRLDETVQLTSLSFLRQCRVRDLRVSLESLPVEMACTDAVLGSLSQLLRANSSLCVLTLAARSTPLVSHALAMALAKLDTLRELCVLSEVFTCHYSARSFVHALVLALPQLIRLHVHYVDARQMMKAITWIRQRKPTGNAPYRERQRSAGVFLDNRPCVGCCRSTFIGLAKPHNRS